ncbi:MAG: hypothetical protein H8E35_05810 [Ardenticatenia bacterium]|nr:hypothetical protein [Ardenticatenia bacterium]
MPPESADGAASNRGKVPLAAYELLWRTALANLKLQMTRATFDTWVRNSWAIERSGSLLVIGVPHSRAQEVLDQRLAVVILRTIQAIPGGEGLRVEFRVASHCVDYS